MAAKKPSASQPKPEGAIVRPGAGQQPAQNDVAYKGAVPMKGFVGWVTLVLAVALFVGFLAAQLLVSQRMSQLVQETSTRVQLQGQGRSAVIAEWVKGLERVGSNLANTETVRLFVTETQKPDADPSLAKALEAQAPYMSEALKEFSARNKLLGAHLIKPDGGILVSWGIVPESLTRGRDLVRDVVQSAKTVSLPLRLAKDGVVMDVLVPVKAPAVDESAPPVVSGVLWFSLPVGDTLAELVAATPLDRPGERTTLLQNEGKNAAVVGRTGLAPLPETYGDLEKRMDAGRVVQTSVVDGKPVFAALNPIGNTPLALLQEYSAADALAVMNLYKPGLYLIVALLVVVLGAMMMALTLHLMAQRNKTRVKLLGQTMEALVRVVEARDPYLAGHHARVARLSIQVGNSLRMGVGERATLYYAAQLSSVGRLLVPRTVLAKKAKLSAAERRDLEGHISQAMSILGELDFDLPIVPVIAQIYEREDGSGHPAGLAGNQISRMAKVLGACDAYVALTSQRAHRKALEKKEALKVMQGGAFAKDVVAAIGKVDGK